MGADRAQHAGDVRVLVETTPGIDRGGNRAGGVGLLADVGLVGDGLPASVGDGRQRLGETGLVDVRREDLLVSSLARRMAVAWPMPEAGPGHDDNTI